MNAEEATAKVLEIPKKRANYGEGSIRKLGPRRWQVSFYDSQGRRKRESFNTEAKARKKLASLSALKDVGKLEPFESRVKVAMLAPSYVTYIEASKPKSADWVKRVWRKHLQPAFGDLLAARIGTDHFERYIADRLAAGAETSTINRELAILKATFNHAADAEPPKIRRVPKFPPKLREPNPRSGFLTDEQYSALQAKCKQAWLRALLCLAYNFGFRKGELLGMRVGQVDLKARTLHLLPGTTKNDKGRTVYLTEEAAALLAECVRDKDANDALFTWRNGKPVRDFRDAWRRLTALAGVSQLLLHDLRRSAVRGMTRAGISQPVAMAISGHKTVEVFRRYDITAESDLRDAARKIEARQNGHKMGTNKTESSENAGK